jgi:bacillolysin
LIRTTSATLTPVDVGQQYYSLSSDANSGWVPDAVSAAFGLSKVYDYCSARHARNSTDGHGSSIIANVRFGINYPDAFCSQQLHEMVFGDGYSSSVDVCGHELTHGVIDSVGVDGVLNYAYQSGALNEAFPDIFGEMVEARTYGTNDWLIGSQLGPFSS